MHTFLSIAESGNSASEKTEKVSHAECKSGVPCMYQNEVDLRIIILTCNRAGALSKLLTSLLALRPLNDTFALDIWIDVDKKNRVDEKTLQVAQSFKWPFAVDVHVQQTHAGIYGQWIDTWRPRADSKELALILEDDLIVSPFAWQWIKAAHAHYGTDDFNMGYTLQSEKRNNAINGKPINVKGTVAFYYRVMGSWGFVPHPKWWRDFQDWYHEKSKDASFKPYVKGIIMTQWFKNFEKKNTADSMWTIWHIFFTDMHKLYAVYNNLNQLTGTDSHNLCVHRAEPGLHYKGKARQDVEKLLLDYWSSTFVDFPEKTPKLDYSGKPIAA